MSKLSKFTLVPLVAFFGFGNVQADAQTKTTANSQKTSKISKTKTKKKPAKPKNEITKMEKDRQKDPTVRQVTPDPKKSPGEHADNLSKNINHEANRESKDINNSLNQFSKNVNHSLQGKKKK